MRLLRSNRAAAKAFTLIELLVVIAVIMVLAAILVPTIQGVLEHVRGSKCRSNLKQMAIAHRKFASNQLRSGQYMAGIATIDGVLAVNTPPTGSWYMPEVVWAKNNFDDPDFGHYRSQGVLTRKSLIDAEVMYCPIWDVDSWMPGKREKAPEQTGGYGGWTTEEIAKATLDTMVCTYEYRGTFGTKAADTTTFVDPKKWRAAIVGEDPETDAVLADVLVMPNLDKKSDSEPNYVSFFEHSPVFKGSKKMPDSGIINTAYLDSHVEAIAPTPLADFKNVNTTVGTRKGWGAVGGSKDTYIALEYTFFNWLSTNKK